jgi:hypothetical protein
MIQFIHFSQFLNNFTQRSYNLLFLILVFVLSYIYLTSNTNKIYIGSKVGTTIIIEVVIGAIKSIVDNQLSGENDDKKDKIILQIRILQIIINKNLKIVKIMIIFTYLNKLI